MTVSSLKAQAVPMLFINVKKAVMAAAAEKVAINGIVTAEDVPLVAFHYCWSDLSGN